MILSVIVPCRNEEKHIEKCVEAIYNNSILKSESIEVIVVDGRSDDDTLSIISGLQKRFDNLRIVTNEKKVTPVAFNLGIKQAQGEYIQIIGARQFVSEDYFEKAIEKFKNSPEIWCIGGAVTNFFEDEKSEIISQAMNSSFGVGGGNFRLAKTSVFVDTVGTPMYPKWVFEKIGFFDESLVRNQDDELNYRVTAAGGKILLFSEISIQYVVRASFKKLYAQYKQYGYWKVYVNKKHKAVTNIRQLAPAGIVMYLFTMPFFYLFEFEEIYAFPWIAYVILALISAFKASDKRANTIKVFYTYLILHFSYGLGYLEGIFTFIILNKSPSANNQKLSR